MAKPSFQHIKQNSQGAALLEVLIAAVVLALISIGVALNSTTASRTLTAITRNNTAHQLAKEKLEELMLSSPSALDDSDDSLELGLMTDKMEFIRQVDVTVNADNSRTIDINVRSARSNTSASIWLSHTLIDW